MRLKEKVEESAIKNGIPKEIWPAVMAVAMDVAKFYVNAIFNESAVPHKWRIFKWASLGKKWWAKHNEDLKLEL